MPRRSQVPQRPPYRRTLILVSLFGGALMLTGGIYAAHYFASDGSRTTLEVYNDDANDRLIVQSNDVADDWSELSVASDVPVRISLGEYNLGVGPMALPLPPKPITNGEPLHACAVGGEREGTLVLRDLFTHDVVARETLQLLACPA